MIVTVTQLASELGRVPTRMEFVRVSKGGDYRLAKLFGNYAVLLQAAGLKTYDERRKPLSNEIFQKDISEVLEAYNPPAITTTEILYRRKLILGDLHAPFVNHHALDFVYKFAEIHKPDFIVQIGDLYDLYAHTKFPRSQNGYGPQQEEELGRKCAEEMWRTVRRICPNAKCVQLKGNHDIRPLRRTLEHLPVLEHVVDKYFNELMTFEGVELITDHRQEYYCDNIQFIHGYRSRIGEHRDYALMNTVCGHQHIGGCVYRRFRNQTIYELNAGLLGDPDSKVMAYTPQKTTNRTPGFGWIDEYGARFIAI